MKDAVKFNEITGLCASEYTYVGTIIKNKVPFLSYFHHKKDSSKDCSLYLKKEDHYILSFESSDFYCAVVKKIKHPVKGLKVEHRDSSWYSPTNNSIYIGSMM